VNPGPPTDAAAATVDLETEPSAAPEVRLRRARTPDIRELVPLITSYADQRILLAKDRVSLYEDIQEFQVAEAVWAGQGIEEAATSELVGCGALHVMWEDLAEVRTLAVAPAWRGRGIGRRLLESLLQQGREVGVTRVFCLTFEVDFFAHHGFRRVVGTPVPADVYAELLRSMDAGVAEFLDLARVKPNTLGNTRMIRLL
jgi:amino-acid N-acetyltransferase